MSTGIKTIGAWTTQVYQQSNQEFAFTIRLVLHGGENRVTGDAGFSCFDEAEMAMHNTQLSWIDKMLDEGRLEALVSVNYGAAFRWWRLRRNGKTKVWKKTPGKFRIPTKAGSRWTDAIDENTLWGDDGSVRAITENVARAMNARTADSPT